MGWDGININEQKLAEKRIRRLAYALTQADERERHRIGNVLHDDLQQQIYGVEMAVRRLRRYLDNELKGEVSQAPATMLSQIEAIHASAIETTRTLSSELNPAILRENDFGVVLQWIVDHLEGRHELKVDLHIDDGPEIDNRELRAFLLRLIRELLFNIVQLADSRQAYVEMYEEEGWLIVKVIDEGNGFDLSKIEGDEGYALLNMRARLRLLDGRLQLDTAPDEGTCATIYLRDRFGEPD